MLEELDTIVAEASRIAKEERASWLDANCPADLREQADSLLDFAELTGRFLQRPVGEQFGRLLVPAEDSAVDRRFGKYRIVKELGHGGMGAVFLAKRDDGDFEQNVAVKIIRQSIVDSAARARFRSEQQILASLNHSNIARLFDGGITDEGDPYFVMEYIEGEPLNTYVDRAQPRLTDKLEIFLKICSAVSFAHRNLIIHRDIKPSNVLVKKDGGPVLLDFGLGKILDPGRSAGDRTQTRFLALTPNYASPEQFEGKSVSTLTDVYSLGVVLYELLCGVTPFSLDDKDLNEMFETVVSRDPVPPSERNGADASTLRGDLDVIVLKALRKEPERRYESAERFAEDITRYLNGLPILARPATTYYRAGKFLRRNKLGVAAAGALAITLAGGIAATLRQSKAANRQRAKAEKRFREVRELANSVLFEVYPKIEDLKGSTEARQEVVNIALKYLDNLSLEAAGDRDLLAELASAYQKIGDVQGNPALSNLGDLKGALDSYSKAEDLITDLLKESPKNALLLDSKATLKQSVALILWWLDRTDEAMACFDEALFIRKGLIKSHPESSEFVKGMIRLQLRQGEVPWWEHRLEDAIRIYSEALGYAERLVDALPEDKSALSLLAQCLTATGVAYNDLLDFQTAEECYLQAESILLPLTRKYPEDYYIGRDLYSVYNRFAELHIIRRDGPATENYALKGIEVIENLAGSDARDLWSARHLSISYTNLGQAEFLKGEYKASIESFLKAMEIVGRLKDEFPENEHIRNYALCLREIGKAELRLGWIDKARESQTRALGLYERIFKDTISGTLLNDVAEIHRQLGKIGIAAGDRGMAVSHFAKADGAFKELAVTGSVSELDRRDHKELRSEMKRLGIPFK